MHNISKRVNKYCNSASQKYKATASVLSAPQDSVSVKMVPYLIGCENSIKEAGNKVVAMAHDALSTLAEPTGSLPKSNNCNPRNNDIGNNNPTNTKEKEDDWDHCESLVAEHNATKQAMAEINNALGGYSATPPPEYYYDHSTSSNYIMLAEEDDMWKVDIC